MRMAARRNNFLNKRQLLTGCRRSRPQLQAPAPQKSVGETPTPTTAAEFGKFIATETAKWAKVVKFAGILKQPA
jgi:hypothetical protein